MQQKRTVEVNGQKFYFMDDSASKHVRSETYNYDFDKISGAFRRWGKDEDDDPQFSPLGPEILDIEVCTNGCEHFCEFCYKGNTNSAPTNMTLDGFKTILDMINPSLTQIAFGITGVQTNPYLLGMMQYCRDLGVVPNVTLTGFDMTRNIAHMITQLAGAISVSVYQTDKELGYNTIRELSLRKAFINMQLLISQETLPFVYEVLEDKTKYPRLAYLHSVIFLGVKPKGRDRDSFKPVSGEQYSNLMRYCNEHEIPYGFDSCSAPQFEESLDRLGMDPRLKILSESCESTLFSLYINVNGDCYGCSFCEGEFKAAPLNVFRYKNFLRDIWYSSQFEEFRGDLLKTIKNGCRHCPVFDLEGVSK